MRNIKTISISNSKVLDNRTNANTPVLLNSIDVNQITGDYAITDTENNSVIIYAQSNNSFINYNNIMAHKKGTINNINPFGKLNYPLDTRFDSLRGKLWIADNRNNRIVRINNFTFVADFIINNINCPYSIFVNLNNGSVFVKSLNIDNTKKISIY